MPVIDCSFAPFKVVPALYEVCQDVAGARANQTEAAAFALQLHSPNASTPSTLLTHEQGDGWGRLGLQLLGGAALVLAVADTLPVTLPLWIAPWVLRGGMGALMLMTEETPMLVPQHQVPNQPQSQPNPLQTPLHQPHPGQTTPGTITPRPDQRIAVPPISPDRVDASSGGGDTQPPDPPTKPTTLDKPDTPDQKAAPDDEPATPADAGSAKRTKLGVVRRGEFGDGSRQSGGASATPFASEPDVARYFEGTFGVNLRQLSPEQRRQLLADIRQRRSDKLNEAKTRPPVDPLERRVKTIEIELLDLLLRDLQPLRGLRRGDADDVESPGLPELGYQTLARTSGLQDLQRSYENLKALKAEMLRRGKPADAYKPESPRNPKDPSSHDIEVLDAFSVFVKRKWRMVDADKGLWSRTAGDAAVPLLDLKPPADALHTSAEKYWTREQVLAALSQLLGVDVSKLSPEQLMERLAAMAKQLPRMELNAGIQRMAPHEQQFLNSAEIDLYRLAVTLLGGKTPPSRLAVQRRLEHMNNPGELRVAAEYSTGVADTLSKQGSEGDKRNIDIARVYAFFAQLKYDFLIRR